MRASFAAITFACAAACGGSPEADSSVASKRSSDTVIETYGRTFDFHSPVDCSLFVIRRVVDTTTFVAEYDATLGTDAMTLGATYSLEPGRPLPIRLDMTVEDGRLLYSLSMSDRDLVVTDAAGQAVLSVSAFDTASPTIVRGDGHLAVENVDLAAAIARAADMQRCAVFVQPDLGFIPSFFRNRRSTVASAEKGIVGSSADAPPILDGLGSKATIPAVYVKAGLCLKPHDGGASLDWRCDCLDRDPGPLVGRELVTCPP